jgi:RHS repeat-associated protein
MSKTGVQTPLAHQLITQLLVFSLFCQPFSLPAKNTDGPRGVASQSGARVAPAHMVEGDGSLETGSANAERPTADGSSVGVSQGSSCPAATSRPAATLLTYTGQINGNCEEPFAVSARLTDECGNALGERQLSFSVGTQSVSAKTDANGVARATVAPPTVSATTALAVNFGGDDDYSPSQDSASARISRVGTFLRYTGKATLAAGTSEPVSAVLRSASTRNPIPNVPVNFEVGSARVSAKTDANGVASATVNLPVTETFGSSQLKINFAGDECREPASVAVEVSAYLRTAFVVWGGNDERLRLGQRVNFWGHSWAKQVTAGDYKAHNDFKGYADTVRQFQLCQVNVRTTGRPPLDNSCWSTKPGQSFPPQDIPEYIGVIVTTSTDKNGAPDFGNIAAMVVVKVDPEPRYGAVPGKPGFGTLVAVIADGEGIFGAVPSFTTTQTQPAAVLPAQNLGVELRLVNNSTAPASNVAVGETFTNLSPPTAAASLGTIPPSGSRTRSFGMTVPALAPRRDDESSRAYQQRLGAADGIVYSSRGLVTFEDSTGRTLAPVDVFSESRLRIPRLAVGINATPCVSPGATIPYVIKLTNVGSAAAMGAAAVVTFPDGTSTRVETDDLEPGQVFSSTINWKVPVIGARSPAESDADYLARLKSFDGKTLKTSASLTWKDALGNSYGAIKQECASVERVPVLSQTAQSPAPMLPGQKTTLPDAVRNVGSGQALEARLRVTNPDTSVFDATPFSLDGGGTTDVQTTLTAPAVAPKEPAETDAAYQTRLRAADNRPIDFALALEWADAAGNTYGPVVGVPRTTEVLPIVLLSLNAPATAESGDTLAYQLTADNVGQAEAFGINLSITLPDGRVQAVTLPAATIPPGDKQAAVVNFKIPGTQAEGQINAQASVNWKDAASNGYGPMSASAATSVLNPNLPPQVNAGPDQTVVLPVPVNLNGTASDDGKPNGSTLTVAWTKVSGPGTVTFADPNRTVTTASFSAEGTYVLRLSASDSVLGASDEATVNVITKPTGPIYSDTTDDFGEGEGVNVVRDESNNLHLDNQTAPFNFIWVAVSSRGTIVKIDTDTGKVVGEYFSSPAGQPKDPSRTTVDHNGNVWASNRAGNSVLRIGLVENGQCVDRNGNGVIDTSRAQDDIRAWTNAGGVDTDGGVETAADECVINYTRVRSSGTRHVSVNTLNDVWVSGTGGQRFDLLDGATGQIKRQEGPVGYGGYGGLIDGKGVIWSARPLLRWDTALPLKGANGGTWKGWGHDSYGLCIDSQGNVWNTALDGNLIYKFAPDGTHLGTFNHGDHWAQGCVIDRHDHVWVAHSLHTSTVGHLKGDGTFVGNVPVGSGPTGVAVDSKGKIWATNHNSRTVSRIDPELGPMGADGETRVGQVDFTTVDLKGNLYNYSDMTGSTLSGAPASGTWTQVFDSAIQGAEWDVVGWNGRVCGDGLLLVNVASSADGLSFSAPVSATNGVGFSAPRGRYLKVSVVFKRASSGESPFLFDLTVGTKGYSLPAADNPAPVVDAGPDQTATMPNPANLVGNTCDAGRVSGLAVSWEKVSGPGAVSFANARVPATSATFAEAGEYTLRLSAGDSNLSSGDEMTVLVLPFNDPPTVSAGADQTVVLPSNVSLLGTVSDDALPKNSSVAISWSKLSGPGEVTFTNLTGAATSATFSVPGDYVLRLTGDDSQLANVDDLSVKVYPPNNAPAVNVGEDRAIRLPDKAALDATVTDDGLPLGKAVTFAWSKVSGPGTVSFANAKASDTTASFSLPGTYVLRLTASDTQLSAGDELTVLVKPANQPPSVSAGTDQSVTLPDALQLDGTVSDDDKLPEGRVLAVTWSKVSGPGTVIFAAPNNPATTASFSEAGTYVLRLSASDSALSRTDDMSVAVSPSPVNLPPNVNAGADQTITLPTKAALAGAANDDRQPAGSTLTVAWSKVSGPGNVTFANAAAVTTTATFSTAGAYVLRLTASDTALTTSDEVAVTVLPVNQPPVVKAGADQLISLPADANLSGTATDDGLPSGGRLTVAWSMVSGPGEASFADASAAATRATFSTGGKYVLRLTASDGELSRADDVAVTVNQSPTADAGADQTVYLPNAAGLGGTVTDDALPPGKTIVVTWSKLSGPGGVTFSKPSAAATSATFGEVGTYVLRLTASDSLLEVSDELTVTVNPPLPPPPTVSINSPADGTEITTRVEVVGSVSNGTWKLDYTLGPDPVFPNTGPWTTIASGSTPVTNGVLGVFDPTLLLNGTYALRLSATDAGGQTTTVIRTATVNGEQKIGNFTVMFEDLNLPIAGLPIQLIRTYDSRDKRVGDFGVGWMLSIKNVRLEKSVELGRHWRGIVAPGTLPQYCLQPSRPNIVTVTFPDNRVYKFQATTTKQCQAISPIEFARFGFTPMPGTRGTLVPEAPLDVLVEGGFPGPVELLDAADSQLGTYDPTVFRFTDEGGIVYVIDQKLGVRSITDPNGNKVTINRDGIIHPTGKSIRFVRDAQGRITQIVDPSGNALNYAYDADGDLVAFKDAESNETKFSYNDAHGLLTITDPRGVQPIRNEYDDRGRLLSHTDAFGNKVTYKHDLDARQELITDRLGNATLYEYDARGNVLRVTDAQGGVTAYAYDSRGNQVSETNPLGAVTAYAFDANDNLLRQTDPLGNTTTFTYNSRRQVLTITDARGGVTTNTYDAKGNLTTTKDALGNVTSHAYGPNGRVVSSTDALGQVTRYQQDGTGNMVKHTDALGHVVEFSYDPNGNAVTETVSRTTPSGVETLVTAFQYDKNNRPVKTTYPDGTSTRVVYDSVGRQVATVDQLGRQSGFQYDEMERLTRSTYPDGTATESSYDVEGRKLTEKDQSGRVTKFGYDKVGRAVTTTHADGSVTTLTYDSIGRVVATTDARGNTTRNEYDARNRRSKTIDALNRVTSLAYDAKGNQVSMTDANNHTTRYEYDAANRPVKVIYDDATTETTSYDALGRIIAKTNQDGKVTRQTYDPLGRLIGVIDGLGQVTRYGYDELGNRTSETDALGRTTRYEYDKLGRPTRWMLPLGMSEAHTYNAVGNLLTRTDFEGKTTTYTYDSLNRLTGKIPDASLGAAAVSFSYTPTSMRASMTDATGTSVYSYDARDRVIAKASPQGAIAYTYDGVGNVLSARSSNSDGFSVDYKYDELNRLSDVTGNAADRGSRPATGVTTYSYDAVGNLAGYMYPNGVRTGYTYNSLNRLTNMAVSKAATLASYAYTLGPAGNRLSVAESGGRVVNYAFDNLYRLTKETVSNDPVSANNGQVSYLYDAVGNRLSRSSTVAAVPPTVHSYDANDRLATDSYDANGNTTSSNGNSYRYDFENRLTELNDGQVKMVYDGDGRRVSKTVGGVTTKYLIDDHNPSGFAQVAEEIVGGSVRRTYTYGHDLLSQQQVGGGNWVVSFYGYDGHGSVRLLTDVGGDVTDTYTYDAFGILVHSDGATPNDYLYAGEQRDSHLGMDYLRARYMIPATGRFLTMDTFAGFDFEPLTLHKYLYASVNPVSNIDPSGNFSVGLPSLMMGLSIIGVLISGIEVIRNPTPANFIWLGISLIGIPGVLAGLKALFLSGRLPGFARIISLLKRVKDATALEGRMRAWMHSGNYIRVFSDEFVQALNKFYNLSRKVVESGFRNINGRISLIEAKNTLNAKTIKYAVRQASETIQTLDDIAREGLQHFDDVDELIIGYESLDAARIGQFAIGEAATTVNGLNVSRLVYSDSGRQVVVNTVYGAIQVFAVHLP